MLSKKQALEKLASLPTCKRERHFTDDPGWPDRIIRMQRFGIKYVVEDYLFASWEDPKQKDRIATLLPTDIPPYIFDEKFKNRQIKLVTLNPQYFIAIQKGVNPRKIEKLINKGLRKNYVMPIHKFGKYHVITNGHHRIATAILMEIPIEEQSWYIMLHKQKE